jgi:transposase
VFRFVLKVAGEKGLIAGKTVGVDSTTLEASAAMKSVVRRDTGEGWKDYVTRLMKEEGVIDPGHEPTDEEVRRYDKTRKDKKASNREWVSETDPDSRIARMKDGRTHLAYKAEHVVDPESGLVPGAEIYAADRGDTETTVDSVLESVVNLSEAGSGARIEGVAADKGYHAAATLELAEFFSPRAYIPEPKRRHPLRWEDKPADFQRCVYDNRRRVRRGKSKALQRLRSERCERSFAHLCETGGMRRTWLRGLEDVTKRYRIAAAAHNLGRILWKLLGVGKPRALQGGLGLLALAHLVMTLLFATSACPSASHPTRRFARAA